MKSIYKLYRDSKQIFLGFLIIILSAVISIFIPLLVKNSLENQINFADVLKLLTVILVQTSLLALGNYIIAKNGEQSIMKLIKTRLYHLIDLPVTFFETEKSGKMSHKIIDSFTDLRDFVARTLPNFISSLVIIVGSIAILILLDWQLSLVLIFSLILLVALLSIFANFSGKYTDMLKEKNGNLSGKLAEFIQQIRLIKFSNAQNDIKSKLEDDLRINSQSALQLAAIDSFVQPLVMLFFIVTIIAIFSYGAFRIQTGTLTLPVLISFLIYLIQLLTPFSQVGLFFSDYAKIKVSLDFLEQIAAVPSELEGESGLTAKIVADFKVNSLELNNVSFAYANGKQVLTNVSLSCQLGEKIALVGPSGSGKSTILRLIERLYQDYDGQIRLNGLDMRDYPVKEWRHLLSVVDQDTALLSFSIRDNLLLGLGHNNQEDLEVALEKAHLLADIKELPLGLDTEIGERGIKLSGGQQQRLQIARAFLKDSPILLMDEATSNLDSETEAMVTKAMSDLTKNKLSLVIAHRLSTIMDSDRIYFVEAGRITGQGSHSELMKTHLRYRKFVEEQIIC